MNISPLKKLNILLEKTIWLDNLERSVAKNIFLFSAILSKIPLFCRDFDHFSLKLAILAVNKLFHLKSAILNFEKLTPRPPLGKFSKTTP